MEHHRVAIIGTGFGGLGAAIRLREAGVSDVILFEKANDVGGTWRDNSYPNCQCDVPSHLYSFSFAPNPDWSRTFAPQAEIWAYLQRVADDYGLRPHIRFGHVVREARWDDAAAHWDIETSHGSYTADFLISAHGGLSAPSIPDIEGLDQFQGARFHSAEWDHAHSLAGKRVAVIGTGASAVQVVPGIAPIVGSLFVFQRTPAWIVPRPDRPVSRGRRWLYQRVPFLQRVNRAWQYVGRELLVPPLVRRPALMRFPEKLARAHLEHQVRGPALRAKLTPTYTIGCKRILLSSDFYPALARDNVELVNTPIRAVTAHGVVTADGVERALDTIVLATGFNVTEHPITECIYGRDRQSIAKQWASGMRAHLGTTVEGFPNFFTLMGPNTGLGHTSIVYMLESQINFIVDCLRVMRERGARVVEVKSETVDAFMAEMQHRLARSVWNSGGCASWYLDANGHNNTMWPGFTWEFRRRTRRFDPSGYELRASGGQLLRRSTNA